MDQYELWYMNDQMENVILYNKIYTFVPNSWKKGMKYFPSLNKNMPSMFIVQIEWQRTTLIKYYSVCHRNSVRVRFICFSK